MDKDKLGQEPAFPTERVNSQQGISKCEYAAIKLRVPDSGEEWLDKMIRKANRRDALIASMQGISSNPNGFIQADGTPHTTESFCKNVFLMADELLKQESNE